MLLISIVLIYYNTVKRQLNSSRGKMKTITVFIGIQIIALLLASCGDNISGPDNLTEDELYNLAYTGPQWPDGFYREDSLAGSIYYENTVSVKPLDKRDNVWILLCTDDIDSARQWSELSSRYSAYYRDLVSEKETDKYFEFKRVYSANPRDVLLSRVHKRSYLDRSMYDFFKRQGVIGIFRKKNFTESDVKELIEYLWFVEHYETGEKVYSSFTQKEGAAYVHYIYDIEISRGDFGVKDEIGFYKNAFTVSTVNGEITRSRELIKQITGKQR